MLDLEHFNVVANNVVETITFAPYCIHFSFEGGITMTLSSDFAMHYDGLPQEEITFPMTNSSLMRILQTSVSAVDLVAEDTLNIRFSNGDQLVFQKQAGYECYQIRNGNEEVFGVP